MCVCLCVCSVWCMCVVLCVWRVWRLCGCMWVGGGGGGGGGVGWCLVLWVFGGVVLCVACRAVGLVWLLVYVCGVCAGRVSAFVLT